MKTIELVKKVQTVVCFLIIKVCQVQVVISLMPPIHIHISVSTALSCDCSSRQCWTTPSSPCMAPALEQSFITIIHILLI